MTTLSDDARRILREARDCINLILGEPEPEPFSWARFSEVAQERVDDDHWRRAQALLSYANLRDQGRLREFDARRALLAAAASVRQVEPRPDFDADEFAAIEVADAVRGQVAGLYWPSAIDADLGAGTAERLAREWLAEQ